MTARQVLEATLVDLDKLQAPSLKLFEFNYLINKAISQYINKQYSIYDTSQQTSDNLRVLKSTAIIQPINPSLQNNTTESETIEYYIKDGKVYKKVIKTSTSDNNLIITTTVFESAKTTITEAQTTNSWIQKNTKTETKPKGFTVYNNYGSYEISLPQDYLHLLNCICVFKLQKDFRCWAKDSYIEVPAIRLTADVWSQIVNDIYNRPTPLRPYYYIHNVNYQNNLPTGINEIGNDYKVTSEKGETSDNISNFPRTFNIKEAQASIINKPIASRVSNNTEVRCEIRCGKDASVFSLAEVHVDYLKSPQYINLTQEQIDLTEDTSQIMEFPDYINQEIINELVLLIMERSQNPRLTTHYQISNSIAKPTEQQATNQN